MLWCCVPYGKTAACIRNKKFYLSTVVRYPVCCLYCITQFEEKEIKHKSIHVSAKRKQSPNDILRMRLITTTNRMDWIRFFGCLNPRNFSSAQYRGFENNDSGCFSGWNIEPRIYVDDDDDSLSVTYQLNCDICHRQIVKFNSNFTIDRWKCSNDSMLRSVCIKKICQHFHSNLAWKKYCFIFFSFLLFGICPQTKSPHWRFYCNQLFRMNERKISSILFWQKIA